MLEIWKKEGHFLDVFLGILQTDNTLPVPVFLMFLLFKKDTALQNGLYFTRNNYVFAAGADAILPLQSGGDIADKLLDLPDAFAVTALKAKHKNIVGVALRMIPRDQGQDAGLTTPVGATQLPVLTRLDRPVELIDDHGVAVLNRRLLEFH